MKSQTNLIEPQGKLKNWVPPFLYMVLIFAISSLEQPPLPMPEFEWLTIDKLYHFVEYAILGALVARALVKAKPTILPIAMGMVYRSGVLYPLWRK